MKWTKKDQEALGHALHDCPDCKSRAHKAFKKKSKLVHKDVVKFLKYKLRLEKKAKMLPETWGCDCTPDKPCDEHFPE